MRQISFAILFAALIITGCGDNVAPPHWVEVCTAYRTTTVLLPAGKVMFPATVRVCIQWTWECQYGEEWKGEKKCRTEKPREVAP